MNTPLKFPRLELILSLSLIPFSILIWVGFISFLQTTFAERAAFHFMVNHLELGETPEFVLQIAGQGLSQPFDVLFSQSEFWVSLVMLVVFLTLLSLVSIRLWKFNPASYPH
jgi:hypothetical protein